MRSVFMILGIRKSWNLGEVEIKRRRKVWDVAWFVGGIFWVFFKSSTQTGMVIPLCQHVFRMGCKYESGAI
jgi:hypothetical protein